MLKIIAISCVLVGIVISFHKVKGINDVVYNPGDISLPQIIQIIQEESVNNSLITSIFKDIEKLNHTKAIIETNIIGFLGKILGKIEGITNATAACSKVVYEGLNAIDQIVVMSNSCFNFKTTIDKTYIINSKIQTLTDSANSVNKTMAKNMQAIITECSQRPLNITSCLDTINRNLAEINLESVVIKILKNLFPSLTNFLNIIECFINLPSSIEKYIQEVGNDVRHCSEDIQKIF